MVVVRWEASVQHTGQRECMSTHVRNRTPSAKKLPQQVAALFDQHTGGKLHPVVQLGIAHQIGQRATHAGFRIRRAKTSLGIRERTMAPAHIAQGSSVTYNVHPSSLQWPLACAARRIATASAWAVGSPRVWVRLWPAASSSPARTITAPTGTSPSSPATAASSSARRIHRWSSASASYPDGGSGTYRCGLPAKLAEQACDTSEQRPAVILMDQDRRVIGICRFEDHFGAVAEEPLHHGLATELQSDNLPLTTSFSSAGSTTTISPSTIPTPSILFPIAWRKRLPPNLPARDPHPSERWAARQGSHHSPQRPVPAPANRARAGTG